MKSLQSNLLSGEVCLPVMVRRRDWSSERYPLSIPDYDNRRSPPHQWTASASSNLIRCRDTRRGMSEHRRQRRRDRQTDYDLNIIKESACEVISHKVVSIPVKHHNMEWYWPGFVMTRCRLGNKRRWQRFVFLRVSLRQKHLSACSSAVCSSYHQAWDCVTKQRLHGVQMVEHHGGKNICWNNQPFFSDARSSARHNLSFCDLLWTPPFKNTPPSSVSGQTAFSAHSSHTHTVIAAEYKTHQ